MGEDDADVPKDDEADVPKEEEQEEPKDDVPKDEDPKEEVEAPKEEEQKEEAPKQEEEKEEPKTEEAPKKKKGKKKKKKKTAASGDDESDEYWQKLSKKGSSINWYCMKLAGKVGTTDKLQFVQEGEGGASEIVEFLKDKEKNIMFLLLKCITTDDAKSVRAKFLYLRMIGSGVKTMQKAKLTGSVGKIDGRFPCKHLTIDISEKCADDLEPKKLVKELLRVGGAHKPDKMSFGPDQGFINILHTHHAFVYFLCCILCIDVLFYIHVIE